MQRIIILSLLICILSIHLNGQTSQPSDLVDKIIASFQTDNFEAYRHLLIDSTDFKEFYDDFIKGNNVKIKAPQSSGFIETEKQFNDSMYIFFIKEFKRLIDKGKKLGINWAQLQKIKFNLADSNILANSNKKSVTGNLFFVYKDITYVVYDILMFQLSSGYKISSIGGIYKIGIED